MEEEKKREKEKAVAVLLLYIYILLIIQNQYQQAVSYILNKFIIIIEPMSNTTSNKTEI